MASNNNDNSGAAAIIGFALAVVGAIAIFIFAVLAFIAFVLTILAIFAWNSPLTIGKWTLYPEEARSFVWRGIAGAAFIPAFALFVSVVFDVPIDWQYLNYMLLGGYVLGSIGVEIMAASEDETAAPPAAYMPPSQQLPAPPRQSLPAPQAESCRFASWDDEEERG